MRHALDCAAARERLSLRLDGESGDWRGLARHLRRCADCRAHLAALSGMARGFAALREPPSADLWPAIERRLGARPLPATQVLARRAAAALLGFAAVAAVARRSGGPPAPAPQAQHAVERLADALASARRPLEPLDEYRLLRLGPHEEESR